jgi:hypothetical protein
LVAKKARGFELGNPQSFTSNLWVLVKLCGHRNAQQHVANKHARRLAVLLRYAGMMLAAIAGELHTHSYHIRRG